MRDFFLLSWMLAISVAALPLAYFILFGWPARRAEFVDKVRGEMDMKVYFEKFWAEGYRDAHASKPKLKPRDFFRIRYEQLIGRWRYLLPAALFLAVVAALSGLVVESALRTGYDRYVIYFAGEAKTEAEAVAAHTLGNPIVLVRLPVKDLDADFAPLPQVQLSLASLAAIAGAYLFVVAQLIQQCRARTLVYSDLCSASLRIIVSVPLGLSVSLLASESLGPFISFGLGAFPIGQLRNLIRRLTTTTLKVEDPRSQDDQTVGMLGVTQTVSDLLIEENITCAQQLADIDPVVLAVRTGLSFDYVLFLAAQSLVWCFLGKTASLLGPLGLADARAIWYLMRQPDRIDAVLKEADDHCKAAATKDGPQAIGQILLRQAFEKIAADPYTIFLVHFTSDMDRARAPGIPATH